MSDRHFPPIDDLTQLILSVFRLNGALVSAGDALVADVGLTSARWQVLGTVAASPESIPVAAIARAMGLTRQNVRVIVNELAAAGLVRLEDNPAHRRARLVVPTEAGKQANALALARQAPWAAALARDIPVERVADAAALLRHLIARLSDDQNEGSHDD